MAGSALRLVISISASADSARSAVWEEIPAAARDVGLARIAPGDLPPDSANALFDVAA
jgi:hypothetical protein